MDFIDRIHEIAGRAEGQLDYLQTEEATKNALIMPFINALGYDVFNPMEVMPEFTADVGTKKGEKVDYAIFQDGKPIILFECKTAGVDLNKAHASQLYRYFAALPEVRFGVLTNGIEYRFFSDLDTPNVMDKQPFFSFVILDYDERAVGELKKFTKSTFDLEEILTTASELKYTAAIQRLIAAEFSEPSDDFVRFFATQVYSGRMIQRVLEDFRTITKKATRRYLNERISDRLKSALEETTQPEPRVEEESQELVEDLADELDETIVRVDKERGILTTEDEIEGFFIVKSILRDVIDPKRIHMRDTKSYCGVILDDSNRKPICRLRFDREPKRLGLIEVVEGRKREQTVDLEDIDDIYQYAEQIRGVVEAYAAE